MNRIVSNKILTFKSLVGHSYASKLYFNFNFNNMIISENKHYYNCGI